MSYVATAPLQRKRVASCRHLIDTIEEARQADRPRDSSPPVNTAQHRYDELALGPLQDSNTPMPDEAGAFLREVYNCRANLQAVNDNCRVRVNPACRSAQTGSDRLYVDPTRYRGCLPGARPRPRL